MTDKQIIIDDVDVSGCKHYKNLTCIADYCLTDMPFGEAKCELNPNCYYKQLQREKQNSQEARDVAIKEFNRAEELKTLLKRKEQECEELKKELQAQRDFTAHEQKLIYCVAYDESCKTGNDCKQKKCIFKDNIKLKQTLAEIKPILEFYANSNMGEEQPDKTYHIMLNGSYIMVYDPKPARQALQKISEVENEN